MLTCFCDYDIVVSWHDEPQVPACFRSVCLPHSSPLLQRLLHRSTYAIRLSYHPLMLHPTGFTHHHVFLCIDLPLHRFALILFESLPFYSHLGVYDVLHPCHTDTTRRLVIFCSFNSCIQSLTTTYLQGLSPCMFRPRSCRFFHLQVGGIICWQQLCMSHLMYTCLYIRTRGAEAVLWRRQRTAGVKISQKKLI